MLSYIEVCQLLYILKNVSLYSKLVIKYTYNYYNDTLPLLLTLTDPRDPNSRNTSVMH
ncbi:hypothetical protein SBF1_8200001 [Candidatus Desulfosporosinus infrequens]|uniref:Uncharacterized protein n=1 Tax=Candidatus Desulfosporosinus infrequens TaxID=2043169 RepID=A0A2U3LU16_9FIRM|nr:hypothetical protein SBF1_8200001 [Candidatus Desulfosporosinus infrequens]